MKNEFANFLIVDFITFKAEDGFHFRASVRNTLGNIVLGSMAQSQTSYGDDVGRAVGGAITAPVEPMLNCFP